MRFAPIALLGFLLAQPLLGVLYMKSARFLFNCHFNIVENECAHPVVEAIGTYFYLCIFALNYKVFSIPYWIGLIAFFLIVFRQLKKRFPETWAKCITIAHPKRTALLLFVAIVLPFILVPFSYYFSIMSFSLFDDLGALLALVPEFPSSGQVRLVLLIAVYLIPSLFLISRSSLHWGIKLFSSMVFCFIYAPAVFWLLFMLPCVEHSACL